ncbi:MAG: putative RNA methylase [Chloroflexi bacterium OLB15]|nr:MAG: putative RNA methylase [Chloroflexi bacterium OLB15]
MLIEVEVTEGLESFAREEISQRTNRHTRFLKGSRDKGALRFEMVGDVRVLFQLRTVESIFLVEQFDIPRPKAFLGDAHFKRLIAQIEKVLKTGKLLFRSFYISAAGSDSSVMQRIRAEIAARTGLIDSESGDLQIRLIPSRDTGGWESLVRLTPRPLSARKWRVCNYEGALNATVAAVMAGLTKPRPDDVFVNFFSGSASLMIERAMLNSASAIIGIENSPEVLRCGLQNAEAAKVNTISLLADIRRAPLKANSATALIADLPFGQRVGKHSENLDLYPAFLFEAGRIAQSGAILSVLTHEIRLMDQVLQANKLWHLDRAIPINLRGLHPRIYVLHRI